MRPSRSLGGALRAVNLLRKLTALAWVTGMLGGAGCGRWPSADSPILGRPAVTASGPLRLAFTCRGRVWVATVVEAARRGAGEGGPGEPRLRAVATALPGETHQDRPVWLAGGESLAMSTWFGSEADLVISAGGLMNRLTSTPGSELLDDVAPDGHLLFEREGFLVEMSVVRVGDASASEWRAGPDRVLTSGRDGRYTPDGRRILFVRGLDREPLGIWRQGYAGGDDSEIFLIDRTTLEVTRITDNPNNDEMPVPLDDAGKRLIACQDRGGTYRAWLVDVLSPRLQRIRRFPSPAGAWPVLSPAVRRGAGRDELELWFEADGRLFRTRGTVRDTGLAFAPAAEVEVILQGASSRQNHFGAALFREVAHWIEDNPFTADRWRTIPGSVRRRFSDEMALAMSREAGEDILARLLGRLGLPGLYVLPGGDKIEEEGEGIAGEQFDAQGPDRELARGLRARGLGYVWVPRLEPEIAAVMDSLDKTSVSAIVLDLRRTWGGWSADSLLASLCGATRARPLIGLTSGKTYGEAEVFADGLRARHCGKLIGRPTEGGAVATELHMLSSGGALVLPVGPVERPTGGLFDGRGIVPDAFVPEQIDPAAERWLEFTLALTAGLPGN